MYAGVNLNWVWSWCVVYIKLMALPINRSCVPVYAYCLNILRWRCMNRPFMLFFREFVNCFLESKHIPSSSNKTYYIHLKIKKKLKESVRKLVTFSNKPVLLNWVCCCRRCLWPTFTSSHKPFWEQAKILETFTTCICLTKKNMTLHYIMKLLIQAKKAKPFLCVCNFFYPPQLWLLFGKCGKNFLCVVKYWKSAWAMYFISLLCGEEEEEVNKERLMVSVAIQGAEIEFVTRIVWRHFSE